MAVDAAYGMDAIAFAGGALSLPHGGAGRDRRCACASRRAT